MTIQEHYERACATPSDINEHLPTLRHYALQCRHITEFGVRGVVSTWALLANGRVGTVVRSYDINPCPVEEAIRGAEECGIDFKFTIGDTKEIIIEPTDLLFIDTLHTYDQLAAELNRHADKVQRWIILHDTTTFGEHGELPGSRGLWQAVTDFQDRCEVLWHIAERYGNNNGLTVLERVE